MQVMAKKKVSGKHVSPRRAVQIPNEWWLLAHELASARPMPTMWLLVELLQKEAKAQGKKELPPLPWDLPNSG
jgi:hypothetical protein